jgi:hypothetical protein
VWACNAFGCEEASTIGRGKGRQRNRSAEPVARRLWRTPIITSQDTGVTWTLIVIQVRVLAA